MALRTYNGFSDTENNFGTPQDSDYGGWTLSSGSATITFLRNTPFYNKYIPGSAFAAAYTGNSLRFESDSTQASLVESPFVTAVG